VRCTPAAGNTTWAGLPAKVTVPPAATGSSTAVPTRSRRACTSLASVALMAVMRAVSACVSVLNSTVARSLGDKPVKLNAPFASGVAWYSSPHAV
jgi:hypothetical protein